MSRFPSRPLVVEFLVYWGADITADPSTWTPTDLTDRWNTAVELTVTDGRSEGAKQAETAKATWSLFNTDGQLTPEDPRSKWWPYVDAGTPCQWIVDAGDGDYELFAGYFSSIKPTWPGRSRHLSLVEVRATGILERLGRGDSPLRPAIFRAVMAQQDELVGYWPLTDGRDATIAASAIPGGTAMTMVGEPQFAETDGPVDGSRYVMVTEDSEFLGSPVIQLSMAGLSAWSIEGGFAAQAEEDTADARAIVATWRTNGTYGDLQWVVTCRRTGGTENVIMAVFWGTTVQSFTTFGDLPGPFFDGRWHHWRASAHQDDSDTISVKWYVDGTQVDQTVMSSFTLGVPVELRVGGYDNGFLLSEVPVTACAWTAVGEIAVYRTHTPAATAAAFFGFVGELAADRIARLCAEEHIPCTIVAGDTAVMGVQRSDTLVGLLQEAEATDLGRLSERHFGVHYRPASTLLNQAVAFTIDAAKRELREPFDPTRDLQRLRNEWKVDRPNGSEATYADLANQLLRGRLDDSETINPRDDSTLIHEASWRTRISMAPGMRYSGLGINLARSPRLIPSWQQLQLGDRVQAVNLLPQHPPGALDQIIEGRTQLIKGRRVWRAALITSPAAPYTVGIIEDDELGRLEADTDTLVAELAAGVTSTFQVQYTDGVVWTTSGVEFPLRVEVGGEHIDISAISGASSPQTFTIRARGVNSVFKTHPAGSKVTVVNALVLS